MTDGEFTNDLVAEKVMEWTKKPVGRLQQPHWFDADGNDHRLFFPLTYAGDDYRVFEHVGTWRDSHLNIRWCRFYKKLLELWQSRDPYWPDEPNNEQIYWLHHYKPGDYSLAALMAIEMEAI